MDLVNYSKVRTITIEETGLLAHSSTELIYFLNVNDIKLVSTFLECVDNNSFKTSTYSDTMLEVRGLADLLKQKYFPHGPHPQSPDCRILQNQALRPDGENRCRSDG